MLAQHAAGLWTARGLLDLGVFCLSRQMVVARLPDGGLWLHSPNEPSAPLREALDRLGTVTWLIAPNCLHHRWLEEWQAAYPAAKLAGAPGLASKRPGLRFDAELGDVPPQAWGGAFEQFLTEGARKLNEVAFFHVQSRTLILTDFVFNQGRQSGLPAFSRLMLTMARAYGHLGPSRLFRLLVDDRSAVKRSVDRMLERWPVERLMMSHGEPVSDDASTRLRAAFAGW